MGEVEINIKLKDVQDVSQLVKFINIRTLPNNRIKWWTILGGFIIYAIGLIVLWIIPDKCIVSEKALIITSILLGTFNAILVYIYSNKGIVTLIAVVGMFIVFMLAIDAISPVEFTEEAGKILKENI